MIRSFSPLRRPRVRGIAERKAPRNQCVVTLVATILDTHRVTIKRRAISLTVKDAGRLTTAGGASAVPAGGGSSLSHSGGLGISLPVLRPVREVLTGLGQARRG
jgi:hypothetical protein